MRPLRVAHVIQNLNFGGMERVLHALARGMASQGVEVHVVVLEYLGVFAAGLESVVTLHHVPRMPRWSLIRPMHLASVLRSIRPDIVHSHSGVWLKAARASLMAGKPRHIHTEHGRRLPIPMADRVLDHFASRGTDVVVAVSPQLREALHATVVHRRCTVTSIPNGVDTGCLQPSRETAASLRREMGIPAGVPVIGSVGRLEPVKNYQLAIEALSLLHRSSALDSSPVLVIAGDGSEHATLLRLAEQRGVRDRVHLLGWRLDAEAVYPIFDLFTLTSRSEGTSISLLEAMSSGVCPVVTDVGGNRAVLGAGLSDLLVPDNDAPALAEAWQRLLVDSRSRLRFAGEARARAREAYTVETMVQSYLTLYRSLIDGRDESRSTGVAH